MNSQRSGAATSRALLRWPLLCGSLLCGPLQAAPGIAGILGCAPAQPVNIAVRIGDDASVSTILQLAGGQSPALRLLDAQTGAVRWSAAATAPADQIFADMWAGFAGSLTAIDLDGDGLHDRLYAGDLAGRLWRFDLHQGAAPEALLTGGIFAVLGGVPAVRAFVAPPDLSLSLPGAGKPWLNIAIGTVSLGSGPGLNRFYVLRDHAALEAWSQKDYEHWRPYTEADLQWANAPAATNDAASVLAADSIAGFYLMLASGSVLAPSITVAGRAVIAVAQDLGAQCSVATIVSSVSVQNGTSSPDGNGDNTDVRDFDHRQPILAPVTTTFRIGFDTDGAEATCHFGDTPIADCSVSTRLTPLWWRREDAD